MKNPDRKTVVVIGAFGFIGVYLVDALVRQGYRVLATGHRSQAASYFRDRSISYAHFDLRRPGDLVNLPADGVFAVVHLAALLPANVASATPLDYANANLLAVLRLLEYCQRIGTRHFITTTSYADVQKLWRVDPPVDDDAPRSFKHDGDHAMYVITKTAAADSVLHYNSEFGFLGSVFRLPPVYGYGPHFSIYKDGEYKKSGFQIFVEKATAGDPIDIHGDKSIVRDIVYIKDVVQAMLKALSSDRAKGFYNIASGRAVSLEEQVRAIIQVHSPKDRPSPIVHRPEIPNNLTSYVFDIRKAGHDFGYHPEYTFLEMIADMKSEQEQGSYQELIDSRKS